MPAFTCANDLDYPHGPEFQAWWFAFQCEIVQHTIGAASRIRNGAEPGHGCTISLPVEYMDFFRGTTDQARAQILVSVINSEVLGNRRRIGDQLAFVFAHTLEVCQLILALNTAIGVHEA